jgi:hypothetical protein
MYLVERPFEVYFPHGTHRGKYTYIYYRGNFYRTCNALLFLGNDGRGVKATKRAVEPVRRMVG